MDLVHMDIIHKTEIMTIVHNGIYQWLQVWPIEHFNYLIRPA
ncbi:hypothetical protein [Pseudomonas phage PfAC09]